jgi:hypothetical protein
MLHLVTAYGFTRTRKKTCLPVWCCSSAVISYHNLHCSAMEPLETDSWYMSQCSMWLHSVWHTVSQDIQWWFYLNMSFYNTCFSSCLYLCHHHGCVLWLQSLHVQQWYRYYHSTNETKVQFQLHVKANLPEKVPVNVMIVSTMSPQKAISCPILLLSVQTIPVTECNCVKWFLHVLLRVRSKTVL